MLAVNASMLFLCMGGLCSAIPFAIQVTDEQTGRGIPLVELRTVNDIRLFTDNNGLVAFDEPGLMDRDVFFHVSSHGYSFPKDGFGIVGKKLRPVYGGSATLVMKRVNIAERLYRLTGAGLYRDTVLLGRESPIQEPLLNGQVMGSDSVFCTLYRDRLYWVWGDTNRPSYPLGTFQAPGATSSLPAAGGLDPFLGINFTYFLASDGFVKGLAAMPGDGPTWITALVTLPDEKNVPRLYASYQKIKPPLTVYRRGLAVFNDDTRQFDYIKDIPMDAPLFPVGHPLSLEDQGNRYVAFAHPYALVRVPATSEGFLDPAGYEGFTPLKYGSTLKNPIVERDHDGMASYAWRRGVLPIGPGEQEQFINNGILKREETPFQLTDAATGNAIRAHGGSVNWNEHRKCWIAITVQLMGSSMLGEVWYAEAPTPTGPWKKGVKILTHNKYSFYNPKHHPYFDQAGGRYIFFEGTYTAEFSGNTDPTPRYNYNQIMYRLDLEDSRLQPARIVIR